MIDEITRLQAELDFFAYERDWQKFHTPPNLAKAISIEANELLENYLWEDPTGKTGFKDRVAEEVADVMIYCLMFCTANDIDPLAAIREKMKINAAKYPIEKCKGNCKKAEEL
jgi:NTP pyrophosphatase (non-canonical NTP hydrolase)